MNTKKPRTGLLYTQRTIQPVENIVNIEARIERFLKISNIERLKTFSDIGYSNIMRPGLNELLKYLANTEENIDIVVFYSFDRLEREKRRINFVMPRLKKSVEDVIYIKNFPDRSEMDEETREGSEISYFV
ncbi:recombinase family protein [Oceanobacillus sp. CF4.6]|uniref:recombinase family protein n=1 Tax=Oceanobacillus sp. CF4.6 TaxID=3373080 RepID=UPI003EE809E4